MKKVRITSVSGWIDDKEVILDVESIDEAISKIQKDEQLVKSIIDEHISWLVEGDIISIPQSFNINTSDTEEGIDVEIQLYDYYQE